MTQTRNRMKKGAETCFLLLCLMVALLLPAGCTGTQTLTSVEGTVDITNYYTYGTFFQVEGSLPAPNKAVERAELVLRKTGTGDKEVFRTEIPFSTSGKKLTFQSSKTIDGGLCLDTLPTGTLLAFLELQDKDGSTKTYALQDATGTGKNQAEEPIEYYTLTHKHRNRKVTTEFFSRGNVETLAFRVKRARLPSDVYDIVIDPGHGGKDPGTEAAGCREADVVLDLAKAAKTALEQDGYNVLLTRDGSEDPNVNFAYTAYDEDGRVNQTCGSKAKLSLSLHLNDNQNTSQNGVQIYRSSLAGNALAADLARALTEETELSYSTMNGSTANGVYTRTFTGADLREARAKAKQKGYTFYDISTRTDYYFMIREYGCRATGAYVDGRNPEYGTNRYRDSNQGVEGCLCELGFLSNPKDRDILLTNARGIANALATGIERYTNSLYETQEQEADLLAKETL